MMDEQIFTGGTTAVVALLSEEIGAMGDSFMGGGDTSRFGRFKIEREERQFVAQFLLVSEKIAIPEQLIEFSREFITTLTEKLLDNHWKQLSQAFQQLDPQNIQNEFNESLSIARKKIKVSTNDEFLKKSVKEYFRA